MNTDLVKLLDAIADLKVIVIGEAMLDCYLTGFSDRLCPEAPVPVVTVTQQHQTPGGAANAAVNICALGGQVTFLSVVGEDGEGSILRQTLSENGVSTKYILTQPGRRTLSKQRLTASQLLLRFDQGSTEAIDAKTEKVLIEQLSSCFVDCDALLISDYGYGILTAAVIEAIAKLQRSSPRVLVVDSKHLVAYRQLNVTAVKPNYKQAIELLKLEMSTTFLSQETRANQIAPYGEQLLELTGAQIVAVTLDAEGAIVFERASNKPGQQQFLLHRTTSVRASQSRTSGAGDTFISTLTLAFAAKASMPVAAELASAAAAVVVGKDGTTACSRRELLEYLQVGGDSQAGEKVESRKSKVESRKSKTLLTTTRGKGILEGTSRIACERYSLLTHKEKYFPSLSELGDRLVSYRAVGCRIVFTNGCFDILHAGHVNYLNHARSLGDILIIGVNSDASVSRLKGSTRPINSLSDRIQVLAALGCVDHLIAFDDDTPINLFRIIRPDVYVKGGDYTKQTLPEAQIVEALGGVVEILPFVENRSTTLMIKRICQAELQSKDGESPQP